ncbi:hypothetical protein Mgra_00002411 [Meloidogyne graminicola]|uniref:Uncharacterized protein n=1 Tax=Meloidogyne graminicola TaxID=189291 RepID=A0A8S9ZWR5_9BILA|nr:hypothetical protein Mgra_00002411 [Meloidogyne graminicola]
MLNNLKILILININLNIFLLINSNNLLNKNIIYQQCSQQLKQLYNNWKKINNKEIKNKILICLLNQNIKEISSNKLLNLTSELLNCEQINLELNDENINYYEKKINNYGISINVERINGLTILNAYFIDNSKQFLYFKRKEWPIEILKDLPKQKPKFKKFPSNGSLEFPLIINNKFLIDKIGICAILTNPFIYNLEINLFSIKVQLHQIVQPFHEHSLHHHQLYYKQNLNFIFPNFVAPFLTSNKVKRGIKY